MIDSNSAITAASSITGGLIVLANKSILNKLLGPTAKYLGEKTLGLVKKADINLDAIFHRAALILGDRLDSPGQVNPRVLKHIIDEGRFCEDEITRAYFAGILASSKTEDLFDDRGAAILDLIRGLSSYQLRLHYIIYHLFREKLLGQRLFINSQKVRQRVCLFMPAPDYYMAIAPSLNYEKQRQEIMSISSHVLFGLKKQFLIDEKTTKANKNTLVMKLPNDFKKYISSNGCLFYPTPQGGELFLWAHGCGKEPPGEIFNKNVAIQPCSIQLPGSCNAFVLPTVEINKNKTSDTKENKRASNNKKG